MENASKALIMAAGVLIGILILSLTVYLFVSFGSTSAEMHKQNAAQQIAQFNSQFTSYEGKECTIYDVVTLANLATENNIYYEFSKRSANKNINYISVYLGGQGFIEDGYGDNKTQGDNDFNELIKNNEVTKYNCHVEISEITQRVYKVEFTSIK